MERTSVFISHAHEDQELAGDVRRLLQESLDLDSTKITCTSDPDYGLRPGEGLEEEIRRRLETARAVFLIATPHARGRDWVHLECAFAERERLSGNLHFYVLTPTRDDRLVVPKPYAGRIAVTMSDGRDLHNFMKHLRAEFGVMGPVLTAPSLSALLELEHRCTTRENEAAKSETTAISAKYRHLKSLIASAAAASLVVGSLLGFLASQVRAATNRDREATKLNDEVNRLKDDLSRQGLEAYNAMTEELRKLPFSGLIHDGSLRPLACTSVAALVPDVDGHERTVEENCDSGGTFTFPGSKLKSDPREPIRLRVRIGRAGKEEHTIPLNRSEGRLAIDILRPAS